MGLLQDTLQEDIKLMKHGWKMTDFVNLISVKYPFDQPFVEFNLENIKKMEFGMLCLFLMVTTCDFRVVY